MEEQICRALINPKGQIQFQSARVNGTTLEEIIEGDKKYGKMIPRNGKYFTFRVADWQNRWMTSKQLRKGVGLAWNTMEKIIDIDVREAKHEEYADFKIYFRKTDDDELLTKNTLMYHYYPINSFDAPNRGVCVVNASYPWTIDGKGIPLHIFDPEHYPNETISTAQTFDFDDVYVHEGPGHGMGLPHSPNKNTKMYGNHSDMADTVFHEKPRETIARWIAKYPERKMSRWKRLRWALYYMVRRDNY